MEAADNEVTVAPGKETAPNMNSPNGVRNTNQEMVRARKSDRSGPRQRQGLGNEVRRRQQLDPTQLEAGPSNRAQSTHRLHSRIDRYEPGRMAMTNLVPTLNPDRRANCQVQFDPQLPGHAGGDEMAHLSISICGDPPDNQTAGCSVSKRKAGPCGYNPALTGSNNGNQNDHASMECHF